MDVIKRSGKKVKYNSEKIYNTAIKTFSDFSTTYNVEEQAQALTTYVHNLIKDMDTVHVEDIQDSIYQYLRQSNMKEVATKFRQVRKQRAEDRLLRKAMDCLSNSLSEDKTTNGNTLAYTPSGKMNNIAESIVKHLSLTKFFSKDIADAANKGYIYIHDNGWTMTGTFTCIQIPLDKMLKDGFSTGHGFLREPSNIKSAFQLAAIVIQSSQNDFYGGQAVPFFDRYMAPYVDKSYRKKLVKTIIRYLDIDYQPHQWDKESTTEALKKLAESYTFTKEMKLERVKEIYALLRSQRPEIVMQEGEIVRALTIARDETIQNTYQGAEALVHNLNTMSSRAGNQVPFSSLNFGLDTTSSGRLVTEQLLLAQEAGLGKHETPIFPILIFQLKKGVNFNPEDTNYDLFKLANRVSAKRLFPTYAFVDSSLNLPYYEKDPVNGAVAYMGCRTRTMANVNGPENSVGRGNLSFTTINLPFLALEADRATKRNGETSVNVFMRLLDKYIDLCAKAMLQRYDLQKSMKTYNEPFAIGQHEYLDSEKCDDDLEYPIEPALKHGSLSVGFVGLAEALIVLTGHHHGESEESDVLGYNIVAKINERCKELTQEYHLNFACLGTPAESYCHTALNQAREEFGIIPRVTDREYFTNSSHVPVYYPIDIQRKMEIEGKYHKLETGGHIAYIELDTDISDNLEAFEQILHIMSDADVGYGAINIPINICPICNHQFYGSKDVSVCPNCKYDERIGIEIPDCCD